MRVVLYTGKGGVGKTTTSAAHAAWAASRGVRTLVASADSAHSLGDVLGCELGPEPTTVDSTGQLDAVEIDARAETERHWGAIRDYLVALFRHQGIEELVADELALMPGAEELTTLLAVEARSREAGDAEYDLVIVDCAPTDVALRMLTLPEVARGSMRLLLRVQRAVAGVVTPLARSVVGFPLPGSEVFHDAEEVLYRRFGRLLEWVQAESTTTRLVVTAERMVIDEAARTWTDLSLFGLHCDAVVMNRLLPDAAAEEPFFREWLEVQAERRREVESGFAPLPLLPAPLGDDEVVGAEALAAHGALVFGETDPRARLCEAQATRFVRDGEAVEAWLPLPQARPDELDVAKLDERLILTLGSRRRAIPLPRHVARLDLVAARLREGKLRVRFAPYGGAEAS
ncbi:MAG: ArsA family ATPase [Myxococcota bacterium]|nr:ArsA family ATPase [Myxococcota bacterium]